MIVFFEERRMREKEKGLAASCSEAFRVCWEDCQLLRRWECIQHHMQQGLPVAGRSAEKEENLVIVAGMDVKKKGSPAQYREASYREKILATGSPGTTMAFGHDTTTHAVLHAGCILAAINVVEDHSDGFSGICVQN